MATYPFPELWYTAHNKDPETVTKLQLQYSMGIITRREYIASLQTIAKKKSVT